ncbi:MAG: hypothetical protein M1812_004224 [Candelaria pacifica]|nr:MAG: hypothetical protein M1812_004224 [Candelaria pacifica]
MKQSSGPRPARHSSRRDESKPQQAQQQTLPSGTSKTSVLPSSLESRPSSEAETQPTPKSILETGKKRKITDAQLGAIGDGSQAKKYMTLTARIKSIPSEVVASKWEVISDPAQARLLDLFKAVQRPVLTNYRDDKTRNEAQSALALVVRTLGKRLPRMPFPSNTKDWHFDYEKLLDGNRTLESLLTPAIHSIELLKAEIEKEERALDGDREQLGELEQNAAFAEKERTRHTKKAHALLKLQDSPTTNAEETNLTGLTNKVTSSTLPLEGESDSNILPLAKQLQNHLDSIQSNTTQILDVGGALVRTRAMVDDACYKHLSPTEYEQISAG